MNNQTTNPVFHGSDIEKISACYHIKKEAIVNFAGNVNPLGLPASVKEAVATHADLFSSYPDREYLSLRNVLSNYCDVPADYILPGNGSSELIALLIEARAPKHTLILGPTYSEYSRELTFSGSTQDYYHLQETSDFRPDLEDLFHTLSDGYDFLIICNPNNPTSSAIFRDELKELLAFCKRKNIFVMIDETYVEFAPDISAITAVPLTKQFSNLMVLRGVSKFYAAPGMRFGYGITGNSEFLKTMREKQIPWSLNSLGAFAGEMLFQDHDYYQQTRNLILSERQKMYETIKKLPTFKIYPAYANFLLVKILKDGVTSFDVFERCIQKGLMILIGIEETDGKEDIDWLCKKIVNLRVFDDENGVMNKSILDIGGDILVISQFTLHASTKKGNRPSYIRAAKPEISIPLYEQFCKELSLALGKEIGTGEFGADMKVELLNDGPVTICMDTKNKE